MCGIAGAVALAQGTIINDEEIERMTYALRRRGPDSSGIWVSTNRMTGLGNRRLAILDISDAGRQPMKHPQRQLWVTFNGEIYNYPELRGRLQREGIKLHTTCDTEALLHLYDLYGDNIVHYLSGMYAFAIWDGEKQRLLLARDPYGIKPLYWSSDGKVLRFASEVRSLKAGGKVSTNISAAGAVGFLLLGYVPEPHSLFANVQSLRSGHILVVDRNGIKSPKPFFSFADTFSSHEDVYASWAPSKGEVVERVSNTLRSSVARHLLSDVPIVIFLSSGLDSASIASYAKTIKDDVNTLTLSVDEFRDRPEDESGLAKETALVLSTNHRQISVSVRDFTSSIDEIVTAIDQPSIDGVNSWFVSRAAANAGFKVALSGLGGDEIFRGYSSFYQVSRMVSALNWVPSGFGRCFRIISSDLIKRFGSPKYAGLFEFGSSYSGAYFLRRGLFMPWELPDIIDPDIARTGWEELALLTCLKESIGSTMSPAVRMMLLETQWYMRNQLLRDTDWASMWHSLEIRVPYVDLRLMMELVPLLVCETPPSKKEMVQGLPIRLSPKVTELKKLGFSVPIQEWLVNSVDDPKMAADRGLRGWAKYILSHQAPEIMKRELVY